MSSNPDPVDIHVGYRVRLRRTLLGMSQEKLGSALGLTFQQIQKYERGANRIGSSRLYKLSKILDVNVSYFFDEMPEDEKMFDGFGEGGLASFEADQVMSRETLELVRGYYCIANSSIRKRVFDLIKAVGVKS
ncbi:MAG: helix-turn-helix transcriptional regulator [Sphingomonadales bacterium]|nr:helix-turn-helix transcriptional regulator [Sphingomonadales bacterium]